MNEVIVGENHFAEVCVDGERAWTLPRKGRVAIKNKSKEA
jgi:hypothetical protein